MEQDVLAIHSTSWIVTVGLVGRDRRSSAKVRRKACLGQDDVRLGRSYGTRPTILSSITRSHLYVLNYEFCMQNSDREVHFQVSQFFEPLEGLDRGSS